MANTYKYFGTGKNKKKFLLTLVVGKRDADGALESARKNKLHARKVVLPNGRVQIWTRRPWYKKPLEKELKQRKKKADKKHKKVKKERAKLAKQGKWS